jgi:hypothetical protein
MKSTQRQLKMPRKKSREGNENAYINIACYIQPCSERSKNAQLTYKIGNRQVVQSYLPSSTIELTTEVIYLCLIVWVKIALQWKVSKITGVDKLCSIWLISINITSVNFWILKQVYKEMCVTTKRRAWHQSTSTTK